MLCSYCACVLDERATSYFLATTKPKLLHSAWHQICVRHVNKISIDRPLSCSEAKSAGMWMVCVYEPYPTWDRVRQLRGNGAARCHWSHAFRLQIVEEKVLSQWIKFHLMDIRHIFSRRSDTPGKYKIFSGEVPRIILWTLAMCPRKIPPYTCTGLHRDQSRTHSILDLCIVFLQYQALHIHYLPQKGGCALSPEKVDNASGHISHMISSLS